MRILPPPFRIEAERVEGADVISVHGELDMSSTPELDHALDDLSSSKAKIVLDLTDCSFIDSTGIALLIVSSRQAEATNGRGPAPPVVVCGLEGQVRRVLEVAGVLDEISFVETLDEALSSFA